MVKFVSVVILLNASGLRKARGNDISKVTDVTHIEGAQGPVLLHQRCCVTRSCRKKWHSPHTFHY